MTDDIRLGKVEAVFADIIWEHEPLSYGKLAELCEAQLQWKKSTTYTVLKRLSEKGLFRNEKGLVSSCISRDDYYMMQSEKIVDDSYQGSFPAFFTAFTARRKLKPEEIQAMSKIIEQLDAENKS